MNQIKQIVIMLIAATIISGCETLMHPPIGGDNQNRIGAYSWHDSVTNCSFVYVRDGLLVALSWSGSNKYDEPFGPPKDYINGGRAELAVYSPRTGVLVKAPFDTPYIDLTKNCSIYTPGRYGKNLYVEFKVLINKDMQAFLTSLVENPTAADPDTLKRIFTKSIRGAKKISREFAIQHNMQNPAHYKTESEIKDEETKLEDSPFVGRDQNDYPDWESITNLTPEGKKMLSKLEKYLDIYTDPPNGPKIFRFFFRTWGPPYIYEHLFDQMLKLDKSEAK